MALSIEESIQSLIIKTIIHCVYAITNKLWGLRALCIEQSEVLGQYQYSGVYRYSRLARSPNR